MEVIQEEMGEMEEDVDEETDGEMEEGAQNPLLGLLRSPCLAAVTAWWPRAVPGGTPRALTSPSPPPAQGGCPGAILGDTNAAALPAGGSASTSRSPSAPRCSAWTGTPTTSSWPPAPATSSAGEGQGDSEGGPQGWCTGGSPSQHSMGQRPGEPHGSLSFPLPGSSLPTSRRWRSGRARRRGAPRCPLGS